MNHRISSLWLLSHLILSPLRTRSKKNCLDTEQSWDCRCWMKWPQLAGWENCRAWKAGRIWRNHLCHFYSPTASTAVFVFRETEKHKWWENVELTETQQWKHYYWFSWGIADSDLLGFHCISLFISYYFLILLCPLSLFTFSLLGGFLAIWLLALRLLNIHS